MILLLLLVLAGYHEIKSAHMPDLPTGHHSNNRNGQDFMLNLLEKTYKSPELKRPSSDVGEPLILTEYIERGELEEARKAARVDQQVFSGRESYSGYFTVNKQYNSNLWFWYFPVPNQPVETTPWIIWLQGGPGVSSMFGLFTEIGPYIVTIDQKLKEMPYTWATNHSLLFIDNPVGTGYSFSDLHGYPSNQTTIGEHMYTALQQFLTIFSELRQAPLVISGESYGGKHIPSLAIQIHRNKNDKQPINLQSLAIGNGFIDPKTLQKLNTFLREIGLLDDKDANVTRSFEEEVVQYIEDGKMIKAYETYNQMFNHFITISGQTNVYNFLIPNSDTDNHHITFINGRKARRALHVGSTKYHSFNSNVYGKLIRDFMASYKQPLEELLESYNVLLYNGHLDIIVAYHPSVNTYHALEFSGANEFPNTRRHQWIHKGEIAGYYKRAGNLLEVMVRNAGHMVPTDQPVHALGLITMFVRGEFPKNMSMDFHKERSVETNT